MQGKKNDLRIILNYAKLPLMLVKGKKATKEAITSLDQWGAVMQETVSNLEIFKTC